jgi:hypothetical protein
LAQPRALKGIQAKINKDRGVRLYRAPQPASWLVDEPVFVVVEPHRAKRAFGEIEDFVPIRWSLACDEVNLIVAIKVDL